MHKEIEETKGSVEIIKYSMTTEAFIERTGNPCRKFGRNHHIAPDFIGE